jgi:pimeloyl-ACP methyl ester carboxylesterase
MANRESLVLVPGLICDATVWQEQVAALGNSRPVHVAVHGLANSLEQMAEQILADAPPAFALAGHSMGGRVALEVLRQAPERVTRLALLGTGHEARAPGEKGEHERALRQGWIELAHREGMLAVVRQSPLLMLHPALMKSAALVAAIEAMGVRAGVAQFEGQIHALLARPDCTGLLGRIGVPTLLLAGVEDNWSPLARHEEMARLIAGSRLVAVPECGHMSTMEQPAAVTRALHDWLEC